MSTVWLDRVCPLICWWTGDTVYTQTASAKLADGGPAARSGLHATDLSGRLGSSEPGRFPQCCAFELRLILLCTGSRVTRLLLQTDGRLGGLHSNSSEELL